MSAKKFQSMGTGELVALIAMLFSTVAFSIDALLPAYPQIATELQSGNATHLILTCFLGGLAVGTLLAGPLSDALGRKRAMYIGALIYISAGAVAWLSNDFETVVVARTLQGVGAAGPRVVSLAIVRDLYSGRQMARIVSFAMVLFTLVPFLAPIMGDMLARFYGWRAILLTFIVFSAITTLWLWLRLKEPLPRDKRVPLRWSVLWASTRETMGHPTVRLAIFVQGIAFGLIFCMITQVQPIYDDVFGRVDSFAYWFGGIALFAAASTSFLNAFLVVRIGMHRLVTLGMVGQVVCAAMALGVVSLWSEYTFPAFVVWQFMLIWLSGLCVGNLNAIALEPMGHIAGLAASLTGGISTLMASALAAFVGYLYDGTALPLLISALCMAIVGTVLMWRLNLQDSTPASAT